MNTTDIAQELLAALDHGQTIPSVAARQSGFSWDHGYDIAAEIVKLRRARGETPVGRKIGFTNRNIWPEYGATSPIWAHVYDDTLIFAKDDKATVSLAGSARPKLEPEIAFKLSAPLAAGEIVTTGTLTAALDIHPGETWSSRYEGLGGVSGLTLKFTD